MKHLWVYIKPYRGKIARMAVFDLVAAIAALFLPYCMNLIVDEGIKEQNAERIVFYAGIMTALALASILSSVIVGRTSCRVGAAFTATVKNELFRKINSLSFEEYSKIGTSSFLTRQTDDVDLLLDVVSTMTYYAVSIPAYLIGGSVLAFFTDWVLALLLFLAIPVILLLVRFIAKRVAPLWEESDKLTDKQNTIVRERLSGIRVIRAFHREEKEHGRIASATGRMSDAMIRANVTSGLLSPVSLFLINLVTVAILLVGGMRMEGGVPLSAGGVVATMEYAALMADGVLNLAWLLVWIPQLSVSVRRIGEVFDCKGMPLSDGKGKVLKGSVSFSDVSFGYAEGKPVLHHVDLEIAEGEIVAIIGGTGAGKSTVLKLLMGFYDGYTGTIALGGESLRSLSEADIRDNLSIALQKSMIFEGTARSNLTMGSYDATEEQMKKAAEIACIAPFIEGQKEGYDMRLAGQGTNVSGGQKQRISIARTLLKDANVYLFDDSFSALDFLTESEVRRGINRCLKGKTQIVVTQRVSTAMHCDKIFVLNEGCVVGCGAHESLLQECSVYREIYSSQMGGKR